MVGTDGSDVGGDSVTAALLLVPPNGEAMTELVDVQATTIHVGMAIAILALAYGTIVSPSILGVETTTVASWAFAATFAAIALLHGAYGRNDLALAFGGAAVGWGSLLLGSSPLAVTAGLLALVVGGAYIAVVMIRERSDSGVAVAE